MKLANGILAFTLAAVFSGTSAWAQTASATAPTVRAFYLTSTSTQNNDEMTTIQYAVRSLMRDQGTTVVLDAAQNAIVVRSTNADDLAVAQQVVEDLDRPHKTYRLTYTVTEVDGAKRIDTQHFAMVLAPGQRTTLSENSRVPIATSSGGGVQTQFTYDDVGMNFDATVTEMGKGVRLQSRVSQTSVAVPDQSEAQAKTDVVLHPVTRQANLEGAAFLTAGKPLVLGSLDIPGSTRHLEVEVVMEEVR